MDEDKKIMLAEIKDWRNSQDFPHPYGTPEEEYEPWEWDDVKRIDWLIGVVEHILE